MKTTMISILAAALVTVCSAAPTAAAAAQSLPAKFTLNFTPREGTTLKSFKPEVLGEDFYGGNLNIGPSHNIGDRKTAQFVGTGDGAILPHKNGEFEYHGVLTVLASSGWVDVYPLFEPDAARTATGFGQIGGKLTWDNGSGPQSLWNACITHEENWELYFNPSSAIKEAHQCLGIDLIVVPA